jgi:pimeloyl-ACP methyl ester carboxylesterase
MQTKTSDLNHAPAHHQPQYTTDVVTARDGGAISYRQLGHGPGIVLLHGAMESSYSHMQLAAALADAYAVYLPDRRSHGQTSPSTKNYSIQTEVDDLEALLDKTGARCVFGVSSGGVIALRAALSLPALVRVAVYEPALFLRDATPKAVLARYDREMSQGKVAAALVTGMKGAQMGPPIFNLMPRWLLERLTASAMKSEAKKKMPEGTMAMRELAPTLHNDFTLVAQMSGNLEQFRALRQDVLLLGGSESPAYLKTALGTLEKTIPHARRIEFPGLNHGGSSDVSQMNRTGDPARVAQEMRRFFAEA